MESRRPALVAAGAALVAALHEGKHILICCESGTFRSGLLALYVLRSLSITFAKATSILNVMRQGMTTAIGMERLERLDRVLLGPNAPGGPTGNTGSSAEQPRARAGGGAFRKEGQSAKTPRPKLHQRKGKAAGAGGRGKGKAKREPQRPSPELIYSELCDPKPTLTVPACWDDGGMFVDARFEACPDAIGPVLSSAISTAVTWRRPSQIVKLQGCALDPVLFVRRADPTSRLPSAMIRGRRGSNASTVSGMTSMSGSTDDPYADLFNHYGDDFGVGAGGKVGGGGGAREGRGTARTKRRRSLDAAKGGSGEGRDGSSNGGDADKTEGAEGSARAPATHGPGAKATNVNNVSPQLFHDDDPDTEDEDDDVDNDNSSHASSSANSVGLSGDEHAAGGSPSGRGPGRSRSGAGYDDIPKLPVRVDDELEKGYESSFVSSHDTERAVSRVSGMQTGALDMADMPPVTPESTVILGDYCAPGLRVTLSAVAQHPTLPGAVLHEWDQQKGVVTCRFYSDGRWVWVMTDDLLPSDADGLLFAHTVNQHEFGVALIEKCFAVLRGSYERIFRIPLEDLLFDFAGTPTQTFDMRELRQTMASSGVEVRDMNKEQQAAAAGVSPSPVPGSTLPLNQFRKHPLKPDEAFVFGDSPLWEQLRGMQENGAVAVGGWYSPRVWNNKRRADGSSSAGAAGDGAGAGGAGAGAGTGGGDGAGPPSITPNGDGGGGADTSGGGSLANGFKPRVDRGYIFNSGPSPDGHVQLLHPVLDPDAEATFAANGSAAGGGGAEENFRRRLSLDADDDEIVAAANAMIEDDDVSRLPSDLSPDALLAAGASAAATGKEKTTASDTLNFGIGVVSEDGTREVAAACEVLPDVFNRIDVVQAFPDTDDGHIFCKRFETGWREYQNGGGPNYVTFRENPM